jgi:hypothetical protein
VIVSVLVLCQTGPSEVIGWGSQQLTVYEIEGIDFGLLASVPRRRGPPFSLSLRAAADARVRDGSTLTCRGTLSLSANQGIDNKLDTCVFFARIASSSLIRAKISLIDYIYCELLQSPRSLLPF